MKRVFQMREQGKMKEVGRRALATVPGTESIESKVALIQALIPLGLQAVAEALAEEVVALAGTRYSRVGGRAGVVRWGRQAGSVYLADQKHTITYPRVRDLAQHTEVPLTTYQRLQEPRAADAGLFRKVLLGLSCRNYEACAEAVPGAFGLRPSTISRRFIRASARHLRTLSERRLEGEELVAVVLDGKTFAHDAMVIALGITLQGQKTILGFVQTATENERVCAAFLRGLVERGLRVESGLLCIIDGAKGLRKALQTVFGTRAVVHNAASGTNGKTWSVTCPRPNRLPGGASCRRRTRSPPMSRRKPHSWPCAKSCACSMSRRQPVWMKGSRTRSRCTGWVSSSPWASV